MRPLVMLLVLAAAPAWAGGTDRYTVEVGPGLRDLSVRACLAAPLPEALVALHPAAASRLRDPRAEPSGAHLRQRDGRISLDVPRGTTCLRYRVTLDDLPSRWRGAAGGLRVGRGLLLAPQLFLWYPERHRSLELTFVLPHETRVSAPWRRLRRNGQRVIYALGGRPYDWGARVALGPLYRTDLDLPGGAVRLAVLDGGPTVDPADLRRWVEIGARALTRVYGRLPVPGPQVLVVPIGPASEPVPWGQVMRGGGDAVHIYVDAGRPLRELVEDWTLYHELSHLLHPRLDGSSRWLYEGLASYYQNVIQARGGRIGARRAWENLHAGFQRGIRGTPRHLTLTEASERMVRDRLFMRVYWSGAAVALLADTELRRRSRGRQSLDTALAGLRACCLPSDRMWSGPELMRRLDVLTGTDIFTGLYAEQADAETFPDLRAVYRALGLAEYEGRLTFEPDGPGARLRAAIMAGPRPAGDAD